MTKIAEKFESLLDAYRKPDGRRWGGRDLEDATRGVITRSYTSALKRGHIENPGYDKLQVIARAMGFPVELWFQEAPVRSAPSVGKVSENAAVAERLEHLFETVEDEQRGRPYTNAEVARMSLDGLSEAEVAAIRSGELANPTIEQVIALAEAFGIAPAYFTTKNLETEVLDEAILAAAGKGKTTAILHKSLGLSDQELDIVLNMMDQLGRLHENGSS